MNVQTAMHAKNPDFVASSGFIFYYPETVFTSFEGLAHKLEVDPTLKQRVLQQVSSAVGWSRSSPPRGMVCQLCMGQRVISAIDEISLRPGKP